MYGSKAVDSHWPKFGGWPFFWFAIVCSDHEQKSQYYCLNREVSITVLLDREGVKKQHIFLNDSPL